jgi:large subunit ribosomal protein L29
MKLSERKKDLRDKSPGELRTELGALLQEQFGLRMQKATQQLTQQRQGVPRPARHRARQNAAQSEDEAGMSEQVASFGGRAAAKGSLIRRRSGASSATRWTRP